MRDIGSGRRWLAARITRLSAVLCTAVAAVTMVETAPAAAEPICTDHRVAVTVSEPVELAGSLCTPAGGAKTVQLLVAGGTYNRSYWMWPGRSYAAAATDAGFATFAIDRLNTGTSSHIDPTAANLTANAEGLHQTIDWLRTRHGFTTVVLAGHSLGSYTVLRHIDLYPRDADAVIVSGISSWAQSGAVDVSLDGGSVLPATLSGIETLRHRSPGDLVIRPELRTKVFHAPDTDAAVVAADNASMDSFPVGEITEAAANFTAPTKTPHRVTVPVLLAIGGAEALFHCAPGVPCQDAGAWAANERPLFPDAPVLEGYILPNAGHCINLANNANAWFAAAQRWVAANTGN